MKIVIIAAKRSIFDKYSKLFQHKLEQFMDCEVLFLFQEEKSHKNFISEINNFAPDIIITVDLLGFEQSTLTDNLAYNLLNCKQIHLLLRQGLENEKYLQKQLSISMFFYCLGDAYFRYLNSDCFHIPYLKRIENWGSDIDENSAEKDGQVLCAILKDVMEECHLR